MSGNSKWKKMIGKKWTFPAIYIIAAVIILAIMWGYQDPNEYPLTREELGLEELTPVVVEGPISDDLLAEKLGEAISVTNFTEQMNWPVENTDNILIYMGFFNKNAADEELEMAIVTFQNELWPHTGMDIVSSDEEAFAVIAALSGKITRAEKDPVVGYVVEIEHENGLVTSYSSLDKLKVASGDKISQGTIIGNASRNMFEKDHGVHLHFEIRKGGLALNPNEFFGQNVEEVLSRLSE